MRKQIKPIRLFILFMCFFLNPLQWTTREIDAGQLKCYLHKQINNHDQQQPIRMHVEWDNESVRYEILVKLYQAGLMYIALSIRPQVILHKRLEDNGSRRYGVQTFHIQRGFAKE